MSKRYGFPSFVSIVDGQILHLTTVNNNNHSNQQKKEPRLFSLFILKKNQVPIFNMQGDNLCQALLIATTSSKRRWGLKL